MGTFSEKVFLHLHMPSEDHSVSDYKQVADALGKKLQPGPFASVYPAEALSALPVWFAKMVANV